MDVLVEPAAPADEAGILRLVDACGLPLDGLVDHLDTALVARADGRVVACAALEVHGDGALLRSVAVDGALRGTGLGQRVVRAALALAHARGVRSVYLLTTTAAQFFPRFGFRPVARDAVPDGVRRSVEFRSACPASAEAMVVEVGDAPERRPPVTGGAQ
jgi:amino-acid N-acetyltransferase